jgi:hypothetical protein
MYEEGDLVVIIENHYPGDADDKGYHHYRIGRVCKIEDITWDSYYEATQYQVRIQNCDLGEPPTQYVFDFHICRPHDYYFCNETAKHLLTAEY